MNEKEKIYGLTNQIGLYGINCYLRPVFLALESMSPYYIYYMLFFYERKNGLYSAELEKQISRMEYSKVIEHDIDAEKWIHWVSRGLSRNKKYIIPIDLYYSDKHPFYYKARHSNHYILLKNYDGIRDEFIVFDEEPGRLNESRREFTTFFNQSVKREDLFQYSIYSSKNGLNHKDWKNKLLVLEVLLSNKAKSVHLEQKLLSLYRQLLINLADNSQLLEQKYFTILKSFIEKKQDVPDSTGIYSAPKELVPFFEHIEFLQIQESLFRIIFGDDSAQKLSQFFIPVINDLQMARKLVFKSLYLESNSTYHMIRDKYLFGIHIKERSLYEAVLSAIDKPGFSLPPVDKIYRDCSSKKRVI